MFSRNKIPTFYMYTVQWVLENKYRTITIINTQNFSINSKSFLSLFADSPPHKPWPQGIHDLFSVPKHVSFWLSYEWSYTKAVFCSFFWSVQCLQVSIHAVACINIWFVLLRSRCISQFVYERVYRSLLCFCFFPCFQLLWIMPYEHSCAFFSLTYTFIFLK